MPDYWLDSNTFIESHRRYYAFDIAPGFWTLIEGQAAVGVIASSTLVYHELVDGSTDDLAQWAKERKDILFVEPDQAVQNRFTDVANHVNAAYSTAHAKTFLRGADPWLIAHAKTYGGVVVTQETPSAGRSKAKLPDVCAHFGVSCCDLFVMLRRLGARWV